MHLVHVRFFDEVYRPEDFIQVNHPDVRDLAARLGTVENAYAWVAENVEYPPGGSYADKHHIDCFGRGGIFNRPVFSQTVYEYWQFPSELLARGYYTGRFMGDCEDTSILLCSLARTAGYNVHVGIGEMRGIGHAWCIYNGQILETTLSRAAAPRAPGDPYELMGYFNELESVETVPDTYARVAEFARSSIKFNNEKCGILSDLY